MMSEKMDQFKEFVASHPLLKFEVRDGKRTWQNIFEEWTLYGEEPFSKYIEKDTRIESVEGQETIRTIVNYIKKINPDSITKTLNNAQKIMSIIQGFQGKPQSLGKSTGDPLFDKRFDDWY